MQGMQKICVQAIFWAFYYVAREPWHRMGIELFSLCQWYICGGVWWALQLCRRWAAPCTWGHYEVLGYVIPNSPVHVCSNHGPHLASKEFVDFACWYDFVNVTSKPWISAVKWFGWKRSQAHSEGNCWVWMGLLSCLVSPLKDGQSLREILQGRWLGTTLRDTSWQKFSTHTVMSTSSAGSQVYKNTQ